VTDTPASQPVRAIDAQLATQHRATSLIDYLRASYADLLAQPVPCRLIEIIQRFSQA
jgi:hypothetical protein